MDKDSREDRKLRMTVSEQQHENTLFLCGKYVNFPLKPTGIICNDAKKIQSNYEKHIVY